MQMDCKLIKLRGKLLDPVAFNFFFGRFEHKLQEISNQHFTLFNLTSLLPAATKGHWRSLLAFPWRFLRCQMAHLHVRLFLDTDFQYCGSTYNPAAVSHTQDTAAFYYYFNWFYKRRLVTACFIWLQLKILKVDIM